MVLLFLLTLFLPSFLFGLEVIDPEETFIRELLEEHTLLSPEEAIGMRIEQIKIVIRDVFEEERDIYPTFLNYLHWNTRPYVIENELLIHEGEIFDPWYLEESLKNLRELGLFSDIRAFIVIGNSGGIIIYFVEKELWSIGVGLSPVGGGGLANIEFWVNESNFLGFGKFIQVGSAFTNANTVTSIYYIDQQLFGSQWEFSQVYKAFVNYDSTYEGHHILTELTYPLYSRDIPIGFHIYFEMQDYLYRIYSGDDLKIYQNNPRIQYLYDRQRIVLEFYPTHSWGIDYKFNLSYGIGWNRVKDTKQAPQPGNPFYLENPALYETDYTLYQEFVKNELRPFSSNKYFLINLQHKHIKYWQTSNFYKFGVEETVELGYNLNLRINYVSELFFNKNNYVEYLFNAEYKNRFKDHFIHVQVGHEGRFENVDIAHLMVDGSFSYYTPSWGLGRLCFNVYAMSSTELLHNGKVYLGGNNGLRGYKANLFAGTKELVFHIEFRSETIHFLSTYLGFVIFFDSGKAAFAWKDMFPLKSAFGVGLRLQFPQFSRLLFRLDFAFPLNDHLSPTNANAWEQLSMGFEHTF